MRTEKAINGIVRTMRDLMPKTAKLITVDSLVATIRIGTSPTVLRNVKVEGDIKSLIVGQDVNLRWDVQQGTGPTPVVLTNVIGTSTGITGIAVDNVTIENSPYGLKVKKIGLDNLTFNPSLVGHTHGDLLSLGGWQVVDGTLFNGDVRLNPRGQIILGTGNDIIFLDSRDTDYRLWVGNVDPTLAALSVSKAGVLTATGATISGTLQSANFVSGVSGWHLDNTGTFEAENGIFRGKLTTFIFEKSYISAVAGTFGVYKSSGKLAYDLTTPAIGAYVSLYAEDAPDDSPLFAVNDVLRIKNSAQDLWFLVVTVTNLTGYTQYTVQFKSGNVGAVVSTGTAVVDYGPANMGYITLSADGTVGSSPNINMATHDGSPWLGGAHITNHLRLGNMNGSYGATVDRYGIGIGDYTAGNYLSYNAAVADTFTIKAGAGKVVLDADGAHITPHNFADIPITYGFFLGNGLEFPAAGAISGFIRTNTSYVQNTGGVNICVWPPGTGSYSYDEFHVSLLNYTQNARLAYLDILANDSGAGVYVYPDLNVGGVTALKSNGDIWNALDIRAGGGLYVGATNIDPATGTIYASVSIDAPTFGTEADFTPTWTGLTTTGSWGTSGHYNKYGHLVYIQIMLWGISGGTTASTWSTTYCNNLPFTETLHDPAGVIDLTLGGLGNGWIGYAANHLWTPTWNARSNYIVITGWMHI